MMRALWSAASGMKGQQTNMDVIAHNIANVNTYGGKKVRAEFQDLIYQNIRDAGAASGADSGSASAADSGSSDSGPASGTPDPGPASGTPDPGPASGTPDPGPANDTP